VGSTRLTGPLGSPGMVLVAQHGDDGGRMTGHQLTQQLEE
jgi:hypothetical protein